MQFQVPQFIETEDTIVGPLTIRQFIYLCAAGIATFLLYFVLDFWLWAGLAVVIMGSGLALALVKINGQSLTKILVSVFRFYWNAQQYTWQPNQNQQLEKTSQSLQSVRPGGFRLEAIIYGLALKNAHRFVQTGQEPPAAKTKEQKERDRFQMVTKKTGEHAAARRVDFF